MNDLVKKKQYLPSTIKGLHRYILINTEKLKAYKAKIRAIEKVGESYEMKKSTIFDGQDLADAILEAEKRLGELLREIPKSGKKTDDHSSKRGSMVSLPKGITHKESHIAQTIARYPEIIEEVKLIAKKQERVHTIEEVYKEIRKRKKEDKQIKRRKAKSIPANIRSEYQIIHDDFSNVKIKEKVDIIITDPPYSKEYLSIDRLQLKDGLVSFS